jgi:hypothetical protein
VKVFHCVECGCSSDELGTGWAAYRCDEPDPDEPADGRPSVALYCPECAGREFGYRPHARPGLEPARTFSVTMVRPGVVPSFEVGAFEYFGRGLPLVGETIVLRRTEGPEAGEVFQGYVTRVNAASDTPIAVTEVVRETSPGEPGDRG